MTMDRMRKYKRFTNNTCARVLFVLFVSWILLIFTASLMPGGASSDQSDTLVKWLGPLLSRFPSITEPGYFVRKMAHLTEYFVLGALAAAQRPPLTGARTAIRAFSGPLTAIIDEHFVQALLSVDRGPSWSDVGLDLLGYYIGLTIIGGIIYIQSSRKAKSPKS
ncbi:MAG: VanZ family protein [Fastidiosipilaceae bacterium]|jgi:VanZ family protein